MENLKSEKRNTLTLVLFVIYLLALIWLILFKLQFSIPDMNEGRIINLIPLLGSFGDNGVFALPKSESTFSLSYLWESIFVC